MSDMPQNDEQESRGEVKRCTKCGETKSLDAFSRDKCKKDGVRSHCKACVAIQGAAYRVAHRDEYLASAAAYRAANRDAIRVRNAAYHAANRVQRRTYMSIYGAAHLVEHRVRNAAHYTTHRDHYRAYATAYQRNYPDVYRAAVQRRRMKIKANGGAGVSSAELSALRAAQSVFCAYCGLPWIVPLQIDHVIPIKQGGPHEIANIVLACPDCNANKGARTPEQWTNRWYYARLRTDSTES